MEFSDPLLSKPPSLSLKAGMQTVYGRAAPVFLKIKQTARVLGILFFCGLLSAKDIGGDTLPSAPEAKREFSPQAKEAAEMESLALYLEVALKGMQNGVLSEPDFERLILALEKNPYAEQLIRVLLFELGKAEKTELFQERLLSLAHRFPDALPLNIAAADLMISAKRPDEAEKLLSAAAETILHGGKKGVDSGVPATSNTRRRSPGKADSQIAVVLAKLILLHASKKDFAGGERFADFVENDPVLREDIRTAQAVLLFRADALGAEERLRPEPIAYFPTPTWEKIRRRDKALETYLNAVSRTDHFGVVESSPVFPLLADLGREEVIEKILLKSLLENQRDLNSWIQLAEVYSKQKCFMNAARVWRRILSDFPQVPWNFYLLYGIALQEGGCLSEALRAYELALLMHPANPPVLHRAAWLLFESGEYRKALRRLSAMPDSFEKFYLEAHCHNRLGKHKEAQEAIRRACAAAEKKFPGDNESLRDLTLTHAVYAEKNGDLATVERLLRGLLLQTPDDPELKNFLGYTLADHGQKLEEAESLIRSALEDDPGKMEILDSMAWVCYRLGKYAEAVQWIEKCLAALEENEESPDAVILDHAGDIYFAAGNKAKAVQYWEKALSFNLEGEVDSAKLRSKIAGAGKK